MSLIKYNAHKILPNPMYNTPYTHYMCGSARPYIHNNIYTLHVTYVVLPIPIYNTPYRHYTAAWFCPALCIIHYIHITHCICGSAQPYV